MHRRDTTAPANFVLSRHQPLHKRVLWGAPVWCVTNNGSEAEQYPAGLSTRRVASSSVCEQRSLTIRECCGKQSYLRCNTQPPATATSPHTHSHDPYAAGAAMPPCHTRPDGAAAAAAAPASTTVAAATTGDAHSTSAAHPSRADQHKQPMRSPPAHSVTEHAGGSKTLPAINPTD